MPSAGGLRVIADGTITISSTAKRFRTDFGDFGLTEEQVLDAEQIWLQSSDNVVRYRFDVDNLVTTTTGFVLNADEILEIKGKELIRVFSMIAESTDAIVWFTLFTRGIT